jgi:hypothetical protein
MDNVQKLNNSTNIPSLQTSRSYLFVDISSRKLVQPKLVCCYYIKIIIICKDLNPPRKSPGTQ